MSRSASTGQAAAKGSRATPRSVVCSSAAFMRSRSGPRRSAAAAPLASVRLERRVEDDGRGLANAAGASSAKLGGFGLTTMRERAEAYGGRLRIESPGRGTRVVVEMPKEGNAD